MMSGYAAVFVIVTAAVLPPAAEAQEAIGYATGGPAAVRTIGIRDSAWQVGGGGEKLRGRLGLGGTVDYVYFPEATETFDGRMTASAPAVGGVAVSATASYYFGNPAAGRRIRPFASAGLGILLGDELVPVLLHLAGGVDWWAARRMGLRFEVRGQAPAMLGFRAGVVFR